MRLSISLLRYFEYMLESNIFRYIHDNTLNLDIWIHENDMILGYIGYVYNVNETVGHDQIEFCLQSEHFPFLFWRINTGQKYAIQQESIFNAISLFYVRENLRYLAVLTRQVKSCAWVAILSPHPPPHHSFWRSLFGFLGELAICERHNSRFFGSNPATLRTPTWHK